MTRGKEWELAEEKEHPLIRPSIFFKEKMTQGDLRRVIMTFRKQRYEVRVVRHTSGSCMKLTCHVQVVSQVMHDNEQK